MAESLCRRPRNSALFYRGRIRVGAKRATRSSPQIREEQKVIPVPGLSGRKIEGNFEGGNVSSDGGLGLLRQVDRWIGLTKSLAKRLPDRRDPDKIAHSVESKLRQRIYGLALGYEDLNDHDPLTPGANAFGYS